MAENAFKERQESDNKNTTTDKHETNTIVPHQPSNEHQTRQDNSTTPNNGNNNCIKQFGKYTNTWGSIQLAAGLLGQTSSCTRCELLVKLHGYTLRVTVAPVGRVTPPCACSECATHSLRSMLAPRLKLVSCGPHTLSVVSVPPDSRSYTKVLLIWGGLKVSDWGGPSRKRGYFEKR